MVGREKMKGKDGCSGGGGLGTESTRVCMVVEVVMREGIWRR